MAYSYTGTTQYNGEDTPDFRDYPLQTKTGINIIASGGIVANGHWGTYEDGAVGIISFSSSSASRSNGDKGNYNLAIIQSKDNGHEFGLQFFTSYKSYPFWHSPDHNQVIKRMLRMEILSQPNDTSTSVKVTGICEATAGFNVSSALKYKTNIHDLPDNYNLDMLMKYRPIMYNLKDDDSENPKIFPGFIAEEIEDLGATLFVTYKDEKPEALDYSRICVHLVKAMQEMKTDYDAKISKLERNYEEMKTDYDAKISKLERNYEEMKTMMETLISKSI
jgi:hypothetical protein